MREQHDLGLMEMAIGVLKGMTEIAGRCILWEVSNMMLRSFRRILGLGRRS
jgi:hypothetical protein